MNHIMIDDEIFLTIYQKLKQISKYKDEYFQFNQKKYEKLNGLLQPFISQIENITNELKYNFEQILNKDIYENFTKLVHENTVELIQKEEISDLMFNNIMITRKSLFHPLIGVISKDNQQRSKSLLNKAKFVSLKNENENKPFILISSSKQKANNFESSSSNKLKWENKKIEIKKIDFPIIKQENSSQVNDKNIGINILNNFETNKTNKDIEGKLMGEKIEINTSKNNNKENSIDNILPIKIIDNEKKILKQDNEMLIQNENLNFTLERKNNFIEQKNSMDNDDL